MQKGEDRMSDRGVAAVPTALLLEDIQDAVDFAE